MSTRPIKLLSAFVLLAAMFACAGEPKQSSTPSTPSPKLESITSLLADGPAPGGPKPRDGSVVGGGPVGANAAPAPEGLTGDSSVAGGGGCIRYRTVIALVSNPRDGRPLYADPTGHGCWSWIRLKQPFGLQFIDGEWKKVLRHEPYCYYNDEQRVWAYDEISLAPPHTPQGDVSNIRRCTENGALNNSVGYLFYAATPDGAWPLKGHEPPETQGSTYVLRFLEIYRSYELYTVDALLNWRDRYNALGFPAVINIGAVGHAPGFVGQVVEQVCKASSQELIGVWSGTGQRDQITPALQAAVSNALDRCTRQR
jgi:hypothetical protein